MNLSQIRQEAAQRLREDGNNFSKLVLVNAAVTTAVSLLVILLSSFQYIRSDGGLSTMDTQILLSTVLTLLQLVSIIAAPFWDAGLVFCSLQQARGQRSTPKMLAEGFLRWGPITVSLLVRWLIYSIISTVCAFAGILFLTILPFPSSVITDMIMNANFIEANQDVQIFLGIYLLLYFASLCALLVPRLYLHRQTVYRIMDDDFCGGARAVDHSCILMKGNRGKLLLLDMSFWWFYILDIGISVLAIVDLLLDAANISLPLSAETASFIFPIAALLARFVLYWLAKPKLMLSYALFYRNAYEESLKKPEPSQPKQMP